MPLPGGATGFTLTGGPYDDPAFQGMAGVLTMSTPVTHVATGERIRKTWNFSVDYSGNFSIGPLPFSDDPAFMPNGFMYTITWQALSYKDTPGNLTFAVPMASGTTVDFDKLTPTTTGVALPTTVFSVNGKTGTVALTASDVGADASGAATAAQAFAVQRANHTGTQAATTITGLATVATTGAYTDLSGRPAAGGASLTPTATKTAAYTAAVGDLAMMNVAGGATTLTLPTAPADKSQVGYRAIGATTAVPLVVNRGGTTDTIGTAGATSATLPMADEVVILQYDAANTRWLAVSAVKTQASLDFRYGRAAPALSSFSYDPTTGNLLSYQEDGITITLTYNADGTVATSQRGADTTQTYSYSGGNLTGVA